MYSEYRRLMAIWPEQGRSQTTDTRPLFQPDGCFDRDIDQAFSRSQLQLTSDLLGLIHAQGPAFFEELVIDVLLAMGYGGRRRDLAARLGRTGDGGVDGVISQDELGLDLIYVQAKRLKPGNTVPVGEVRDFAGSLDAHHAGKGIFVSTSHFSDAAVAFCSQVSRRVVLIDGSKFTELMVRHNIGVRVKQSYQIKRIDLDYFSPAGVARRNEEPRHVPPHFGK
jgi:restriction system protein